MRKLKLLLLALTLLLLILANTKPASAACAIAITINDTPYQACKGFDEHQDTLAALDIPGFSYDKDSHTITLNGFNGTLSGYCGGSCQGEIADILPAINISGDSIINGIAFKASTAAAIITTENTEVTTTTIPSSETTEAPLIISDSEKPETKENGNQTNPMSDTKTDNKPSSFFDPMTKYPLYFIAEALLVASATCGIVAAVQKSKTKKISQTPDDNISPEDTFNH